MLTILIIGTIVGFTLYICSNKTYNTVLEGISYFILILTVFLCAVSALLSTDILAPKGYTEVESIYYVTESGVMETIPGPLFEKDGVYYQRESTKAEWIPFHPIEYTKIPLPENFLHAQEQVCPYCGSTIKKE